MKHLFKKTRSGFTLIELIIVIAIIGILTALIMPNFMAGRIRARDAAKKADMRSFKQALQLYYNDYQTYPESNQNNTSIDGCGTDGKLDCDSRADGASFETDSTTYLKQFPKGFKYYAILNQDTYLLEILLENASDDDLEDSYDKCEYECDQAFSGQSTCTPTGGEAYYYVCPD